VFRSRQSGGEIRLEKNIFKNRHYNSYSMENKKELRFLIYVETSIANGDFRSRKIRFYNGFCRLIGVASVGLSTALYIEPTIPVSISIILAATGCIGAVANKTQSVAMSANGTEMSLKRFRGNG